MLGLKIGGWSGSTCFSLMFITATLIKVEASCPARCLPGNDCESEKDGGCPNCDENYYGRFCEHRMECVYGSSNRYDGRINHTVSGIICQAWAAKYPHIPTLETFSHLELNYCRDPDNEGYPWCYTTDPGLRWQFCPVPNCSSQCRAPLLYPGTVILNPAKPAKGFPSNFSAQILCPNETFEMMQCNNVTWGNFSCAELDFTCTVRPMLGRQFENFSLNCESKNKNITQMNITLEDSQDYFWSTSFNDVNLYDLPAGSRSKGYILILLVNANLADGSVVFFKAHVQVMPLSSDEAIEILLTSGLTSSTAEIFSSALTSLSVTDGKKIISSAIDMIKKSNVTELDEMNNVVRILNASSSFLFGVSDADAFVDVMDTFSAVVHTFLNVSSTNTTSSKNMLELSGSLLTKSGAVIKQASDKIIDTDILLVAKQTLQVESALNNIIDSVSSSLSNDEETVSVDTNNLKLKIIKSRSNIGKQSIEFESNEQGEINSNLSLQMPNLDEELQFDENNSLITQIVVLPGNPYTWDVSADNIQSSVVKVTLKNKSLQELSVTNTSKPFVLRFPLTGATNYSAYHLRYHLNSKSGEICSNRINDYLLGNLKMKKNDNLYFIKLYTEDNHFSTWKYLRSLHYESFQLNDILNNGQVINMGPTFTDYFSTTTGPNEGEVTVALALDRPSTFCHPENINIINVSVTLETFSRYCGYFDSLMSQWSTDGCQVSTSQVSSWFVECTCNHLSSFAAGFIILPNSINPFNDAALFLTFFSNPVVVCAVIMIWIIYFVFLVIARRMDNQEHIKGGACVLEDNDPNDKYIYLVGVMTGWWRYAGTTSNVYICLHGSKGHSAKHHLSDGVIPRLKTGAEDWFVLTTPTSLGTLNQVSMWHDNSGTDPSWFLKQVVIKDVIAEETTYFLFDNWLAVNCDLTQTEVIIPATSGRDLTRKTFYQFRLQSVKDLKEKHLWISIIYCPPLSPFTRVQRLTCALSLLLCTMLASIMFHGIATDDPEDQLNRGEFTLSLSDLVIGIESGIIMFPINFLIMQVFTRLQSKPKENVSTKNLEKQLSASYIYQSLINCDRKSVNGQRPILQSSIPNNKFSANSLKCPNSDFHPNLCQKDSQGGGNHFHENSRSGTGSESMHVHLRQNQPFGDNHVISFQTPSCLTKEEPESTTLDAGNSYIGTETLKKRSFVFPYWFVYVGWFLVLSSSMISSYFVMLYGLKYGYHKSLEWLVSFFTAFFQSATVNQPLKVFIIAVLLTVIFKKPVEYDILNATDNLDIEKEKEYVQEDLLKKHGVLIKQSDNQQGYVPQSMSSKIMAEIQHRLRLDSEVAAVIQELVMYFTFIAIVLFMVHGHQNVHTNFMTTSDCESMFCRAMYGDITTLEEVTSIDAVWIYLNDVIDKILHFDDDTNKHIANGASFLVGKARIRQKRIKQDLSDDKVDIIRHYFDNVTCHGEFSLMDEETGSFNKSWSQRIPINDSRADPWRFQTAFALRTMPFVGQFASYTGGGYVSEIDNSKKEALQQIKQLESQKWIDENTRAVFVEFTVHNPNVNLITVGIVVFEFTVYGKIFPNSQFFTSKLYHYTNDFEIFVAVCEVLFVIYIILFTRLEIKKFCRLKKQVYFGDSWSYVECAIIVLGYSTLAIFIQRHVTLSFIMDEYLNNRNKFTSFYGAIFWDFVQTYVMAFMIFLVILKTLKLFRFNQRTLMLTSTLRYVRKSLFNFAFFFFIYVVAFSSFAQLVFGYWLFDFIDFGHSAWAIFNMLLGQFSYYEIEQAERVFGPIFFFVFSIVMFYCLITIFLIIILDGFRSVHQSFKTSPPELPFTKYIIYRIHLLLGTTRPKNVS